MATHSSTLASKIPWPEESGGLQSMGSQRVGYNRATSLSYKQTGKNVCINISTNSYAKNFHATEVPHFL